MATLLLTTVGTLVGGPIGGAIGAFAGQQIDSAIFGSGSYEGPRLKDLAVTTSSYGQPIPRCFGTMRAAGTVIWATELKESKESNGGGKGKPKTTTYSYSASFAVALSGRTIHDVGRIWADGDLLRGSSGDLKVGGSMRIYHGAQDQPADPLIAAAEGANCPAFRDCSYVVFEDLELGDFGNRIPALTFEVHADKSGGVDLRDIVSEQPDASPPTLLPNLLGFADEGGELGSTLGAINQVFPLICDATRQSLTCALQIASAGAERVLPEPLSQGQDADERGADSFKKQRAAEARPQPTAMRYYDQDRDYQPGVQRSVGGPTAGKELMLQFPGAFTADRAREVCAAASLRARWVGEEITWRMAQVDTSIMPGAIVRVPGQPGAWIVRAWEWLDRGVELELERVMAQSGTSPHGDSGGTFPPVDLLTGRSVLKALELPWDGTGSPADTSIFAAVSSQSEGWRGAYLYLERAGGLIDLGPAGQSRAVLGSLTSPLGTSHATHFERAANFDIELVGGGLALTDTTINGLAAGANKMLVGTEVIQFARATQIDETRWRLSGLLRGRAGTEWAAQGGHEIGTDVVLLDDRLTPLSSGQVPSSPSTVLAAIGLGDDEPVTSSLVGAGSTRRPLSPVHPRHEWRDNGDLLLSWTRRARGQWNWEDYVDVAVVEEAVRFRICLGPVEAPHAVWETSATEQILPAAEVSSLIDANGLSDLHVRQIGTHGQSQATFITQLA